ncbi:twin-arginine translocase TatA/TatE family subunit [Cryobacterium adonitolivorans]|uniref:twin-arginine translocase TatA/TatE family subunit n=1 Tax=Cryobacterium adonitolivorans TaxID=1259189 RepID=UPI003B97D002
MFGLTFEKLLLIGLVAVFLVGPDKLPRYALMLGRLVRRLRALASGATDRMRDEMGPEFDDVDWKKYDPRRYDPRRIIRDALVNIDEPAPRDTSPTQGSSLDLPSPPAVGEQNDPPISRTLPPRSRSFGSDSSEGDSES